jgi:hypothetical protein
MEIRVDGTLLRQVAVFKYLGMLLTASLSPADHATRALERARAAASTVAPLLLRLSISSFRRLKMYLGAFVESQFYGLELMPLSALSALSSARAMFVRKIFDLPSTASHELAIILLKMPPPEIAMLRRMRSFLASCKSHDFVFVRDAMLIDREFLSSVPTAFFHNLVRLLRKFDPDLSSTLSVDELLVATNRIIFCSGSPSFIFHYIRRGDSSSLSFFRLFGSPSILVSFRAHLEAKPYVARRLLILFCSSLLRFRFCSSPRELCPLCGRPWMWEHFFSCPRLDVAPGLDSGHHTLLIVSTFVQEGDWVSFDHYVHFYLLLWRDQTYDPALAVSTIDSLTQ